MEFHSGEVWTLLSRGVQISDIYIFIYGSTFFEESALKLACKRQRPGRDECSSQLKTTGFCRQDPNNGGKMQMNIILFGQNFNLGIYYKSWDTSLMLHEDVRMQQNEINLSQAWLTISFLQPKTRNHSEMVGGAHHDKIKFIPAGWVTHRLKNNNTKKFCTIVKVLNCRSGFPAWGSKKGTGNTQAIWPWGPVGFDYRPFRGLGETEAPVLRRHKQNFACTKTQRKGVMTPQETEPKLPASAAGPPVEAWADRDLPLEHWKVPLGINSLAVHPTINDPMAGLPQANYQRGSTTPPISM